MYERKKTLNVLVGGIGVGGNNPVRIQSMTSTDTSDIDATVSQITELITAGSEMVRMTVNDISAAKATPKIIEKIRKNFETPIIGDFHFNGNRLLKTIPDCAKALDKYRINPGNADDTNFREMIEIAKQYDKPVRIGVNGGSVDKKILEKNMEQNAQLTRPLNSEQILSQSIIDSVLLSVKTAKSYDLPENKIIVSAKISHPQELIFIYRSLSKKLNIPLHLGLTEAGMGEEGIITSVAALSPLLIDGIGDTIRLSLTPTPQSSRIKEVEVAKHLLSGFGIRPMIPRVISCPGCGRTTSDYFRHLTENTKKHINQKMSEWENYPEIGKLKIAVMGCVVNGPGESASANIGISLPGKMEKPIAPVYVDGKKITTLKGQNIQIDFLKIIDKYVAENFRENLNISGGAR